MSTEIFHDLEAEQGHLEEVLSGLPAADWSRASAADGWTVADVVLHLAQTEEAVVASASAGADVVQWRDYADNVDEAMAAMVRAERPAPPEIFQRWRTARRAALAALQRADPRQPLRWVTTPLKPRTLATTRLAEHWTHALDIAVPLGIDYPDTARLRHIAWLGHSTLPYALGLAGQPPAEIYCELTAPDGTFWRYGPPEADSSITGPAGAFCRVGARRLAPADSGLVTRGPYGAAALRVLRTYAL
ncbi:MAG: maleylpyruvate isomerase family mycothiol-dependent enzyme [Micromonosporaceae bacterium]|nr:maleylpyruvate isomerase family mycothiol-dependent enzyme [Micromonosporaceae bacterium]